MQWPQKIMWITCPNKLDQELQYFTSFVCWQRTTDQYILSMKENTIPFITDLLSVDLPMVAVFKATFAMEKMASFIYMPQSFITATTKMRSAYFL